MALGDMAQDLDVHESWRDLTRNSLICSALFHVAILTFVIVKLPDLFTPALVDVQILRHVAKRHR